MGTGVLLAAVALLALAALLVLVHGAGDASAAAEAPVPARIPAKVPALDAAITPREFERHCADALAARGWSVTVGKGSADQGVDVLARKGGRSVVLQCKLYARPVGNKAVQEALAGRGYAGADGAAVVTNASYTAAAHALAGRVGVLLLHVSDLPRADALFRFPAGGDAAAEARPAARARRAAPPARRPWRIGWAVPALALGGLGLLLLVPRAEPGSGPGLGLGPEREPRSARVAAGRAAEAALPLPPPSPPRPPRARGAG